MIKAVVFDFDGVIVLSSKPRFDALQQAAIHHGVEIEDDLFAKSVGQITVDFMTKNFPHLDKNTLRKILAEYRSEYKDKIMEHTVSVPFVNEFIRTYKGNHTLAIASTNNIKTIDAILSHLNIRQQFKLVVGREHISQHKPHPEIYLYVAEKLGIEPSMCVAIEDSPIGALSASRAGMNVYGLLNGINTPADFNSVKMAGFIASLSQLNEILQ